MFQTKAASQGHFHLLLEDSRATKPLAPGVAVNSLCNHSFAFLFSFFFWVYLTDLLKKQRGNTNDMFNTDQLMALQHPKEHKYHIITSPQHRLRTKGQRASFRHSAVCQGSTEPSLPLCNTPKPLPSVSSLGGTCPPMMIVKQTLNGHELIQPGGPGNRVTGERSCLGLVNALWAGARSAADKLHPCFIPVGCDVKMGILSKWLGNHFKGVLSKSLNPSPGQQSHCCSPCLRF